MQGNIETTLPFTDPYTLSIQDATKALEDYERTLSQLNNEISEHEVCLFTRLSLTCQNVIKKISELLKDKKASRTDIRRKITNAKQLKTTQARQAKKTKIIQQNRQQAAIKQATPSVPAGYCHFYHAPGQRCNSEAALTGSASFCYQHQPPNSDLTMRPMFNNFDIRPPPVIDVDLYQNMTILGRDTNLRQDQHNPQQLSNQHNFIQQPSNQHNYNQHNYNQHNYNQHNSNQHNSNQHNSNQESESELPRSVTDLKNHFNCMSFK